MVSIEINTTNKLQSVSGGAKVLVPYVGVSKPVGEGLKVYDKKSDQWVDPENNQGRKIHLSPIATYYYAEVGRMRFDTKLVRNITWMVNLQRIMRAMINRHVSHIESSVIRGLPIADSKVTEYNGNENYNDEDFDVKMFVGLQ